MYVEDFEGRTLSKSETFTDFIGFPASNVSLDAVMSIFEALMLPGFKRWYSSINVGCIVSYSLLK